MPANRKKLFLVISFAAVFIAGVFGIYRSRGTFFDTPETARPITRPDGTPWRIAYYEGGPFSNYTARMKAVVKGLAEQGWIEPLEIPSFDDPEDAQAIWDYLAENASGKYIEFAPGGFWSCGWDKERRAASKTDAIKALQEGRFDLMIAMGTWAGQDLATSEHRTPTIVLSCTDPVAAGIIKSVEDSGQEHVMARCRPGEDLRQVLLFHDIFGFRKLGVTHEDSDDGRLYSNLAELKEAGRQRGFEVIECIAPDTGLSDEECRDAILGCYEKLAPQVDAMWIGEHRGESPRFIPEILETMFRFNIPTWAKSNSVRVQRGVLITISRKDSLPMGRWAVSQIGRIFHGEKPGDLEQAFNDPLVIAINLETARRIGFDVPKSLLETAGEIYDTIESDDIR